LKTKQQKQGPRCCKKFKTRKQLLPQKAAVVLPFAAETFFEKMNQI
jgi:hypothetical protein